MLQLSLAEWRCSVAGGVRGAESRALERLARARVMPTPALIGAFASMHAYEGRWQTAFARLAASGEAALVAGGGPSEGRLSAHSDARFARVLGAVRRPEQLGHALTVLTLMLEQVFDFSTQKPISPICRTPLSPYLRILFFFWSL